VQALLDIFGNVKADVGSTITVKVETQAEE